MRENPAPPTTNRPSFSSYRKHLVESSARSAVAVSSKFENEGEEDYAGHHLLRREIDSPGPGQMPLLSGQCPNTVGQVPSS